MKIKRKINYTYIKPSTNFVQLFYNSFIKKYPVLKQNHLIIDFSKIINIKTQELLLFLDISDVHKKNNLSFILVSSTAEIDELPHELNVVPTVLEAEDLLEMDNIERELGF